MCTVMVCLRCWCQTSVPRTQVHMESANLQVLMRGKKLDMHLHNGSLLLTAPSVGLNQLLPHITHLHEED